MLLSVLTLYHNDEHLFDPLQLPQGIDRDTLVNLTLLHTAELECLYPQPETFKIALGAWSTARLPSWSKMVAALSDNYNPLHNYDRTETETTARNTTRDASDEKTETGTISGTNSSTTNTTGSTTTGSSDTQSNTNQVSGFNSTSWANKDKSDLTTSRQGTDQTTGQGTVSGQNSQTDSRSATAETSETVDEDVSRTLRASGNIGVTTNQEMLQAELDVRSLDFYHIFVREFKKQFCLLIY